MFWLSKALLLTAEVTEVKAAVSFTKATIQNRAEKIKENDVPCTKLKP